MAFFVVLKANVGLLTTRSASICTIHAIQELFCNYTNKNTNTNTIQELFETNWNPDKCVKEQLLLEEKNSKIVLKICKTNQIVLKIGDLIISNWNLIWNNLRKIGQLWLIRVGTTIRNSNTNGIKSSSKLQFQPQIVLTILDHF